MQTCKDGTLSSTEFNSTPFIASVMQEYFLKLVSLQADWLARVRYVARS